MENKNIFKVDLVLIVGTLLVLIVLVGYSSPLVIAPIEDSNISSNDVLFSIRKTDKLLIDDNINFTNPNQYLLKDGLKLELKKGTYYLKTLGEQINEIKTLYIESNVILELKLNGEMYDVINVGKSSINVDVYDKDSLIRHMKLTPTKTKSKRSMI